MHERLVPILDRRDPAPRLHLRIAAEPFAFEDVREVITERAVAGHARGFAEHHLADVERDVAMCVDVLSERQRFTIKCVLIPFPATVAVKLDMREMSTMAV